MGGGVTLVFERSVQPTNYFINSRHFSLLINTICIVMYYSYEEKACEYQNVTLERKVRAPQSSENVTSEPQFERIVYKSTLVT